MTVTTKEAVREYMSNRTKERKPPPSQNEVRRMLGWEFLDMQREKSEQIIILRGDR